MKSMKKSMFVTTILMVVLLIVALSTATFAWYTANTAVSVSKTQVTSASSDTASLVVDGAIAASKNAKTSSVTLTMNQSIAPMIYAVAPSGEPSKPQAPSSTTTYGDFIASFKTFTADNAGNFASVASAGTPSTIQTNGVVGAGVGGQTGSTIFLTNVGGVAISSITAKVNIENYSYTAVDTSEFVNGETDVSAYFTKTGDEYASAGANAKFVTGTAYYSRSLENENLCVAIFSGSSSAEPATFTLKGIFSNLSTHQVGNATTIAAATTSPKVAINTAVGSEENACRAADGSVASDNLLPASIGQLQGIQVLVVAWYEGAGMTNSIAGTGANFTISFTAA